MQWQLTMQNILAFIIAWKVWHNAYLIRKVTLKDFLKQIMPSPRFWVLKANDISDKWPVTQSVTIMMQQLKSFLIPSTDNMFSIKMSLMIAKKPVTGTRTMVFSQLTSTGQNLILVRYFWPVLNTKQAEPGRDILLPWGDQETFLFAPNTLYISSTPWISTVYGFWALLKLIFSQRAMPKEKVFVV